MSEEKSDVQQSTHDGCFNYPAPRPPIPGKERAAFADDFPQMDWSKLRAASPSPRNRLFGVQSESPPACLKWTESLHTLLQDSDGVSLFRNYLLSEGPHHAAQLDFWFACEGLRKQVAREKVQQLVKVIYKKFFVKSALPIYEDLRKEIGRRIKSSQCLEPSLFDEAQAHVEHLINTTTYPNFLKSDMYLHYLESVQNSSSSGSSELSSSEQVNFASGPDLLPTLHEDMELVMSQPTQISHNSGTGSLSTGYLTPNVSAGAVRLTKDLLLMSQKHRMVDVRPKSEAYASMYMYRGNAHAAYNSYNPVSRQDSEMQSVSSHSDARTESDNMSLTDSSIDGRSLGRSSRRQAALEKRHARESASLNREQHMHQMLIPRTQRVDARQCQPMQPDTFAAILTEKLEQVKREQDTNELLEKKLKESESMSSIDKIRMLQLEDDNDQDILDQHVSRVFSDLTPARSPGVSSPRALSPPRNRHIQSTMYARPRRKDKDGFSTFSNDSGNVHDFPDTSEHKMSMVKSKSMPEYAEERFMRGSACRRSSSKKTLTDLTDSGVSVVSDTPPVPPVKDNRVLAWLMESDKSGRGISHTYSEMSPKHKSHRASSATSPSSSRHRKGFGSRSSSLERNSVSGTLGPAQPFVADPSMPPLPIPNTSIQLEEARRRLLEDNSDRTKTRQRSSNRYYPDTTQSSQSTLRKSTRSRPAMPVSAPIDDVTTVVFSFCDEQFPYRTKIPGTQVTLRQFKEYLPKKGNYRFFFKTVCEDLDNQVIHEEVSNDGDILPLWEGKVMAQVKPLD